MSRKTVLREVFPLPTVGCHWSALLLVLVFAAPASAIDYQSGKFRISWDNTLSWGAAWRLEDRDTRIIGLTNGGTAYSVNGNDGDLNYDKNLFSNAVKLTSELEVSYKNFGAFVRGFGFYDYENEEGTRARSPLSEEALDSSAPGSSCAESLRMKLTALSAPLIPGVPMMLMHLLS